MLTKETIVQYLGRPLTASENSNFDSYLEIATKRLSTLLGFSFSTTAGARTFDVRDGYRTAFIDPFTDVSAVAVNGQSLTTYVKKQNDSYQGDWFNSLEFDDRLHGGRIEVTASWGFGGALPEDLAKLLAAVFGIHELETVRVRNNVKSKKIEDTAVTYKDGTDFDRVVTAHIGTVQKYAQVERAVSHGLVQPVYDY
jgi:hypothetical protein